MTAGVSGPEVALAKGATEHLAEQASAFSLATASHDALTVAKQCILDWFGVSVGGRDEASVRLLVDEVGEDGGNSHATALATGKRVTVGQAALLNGTTSHALDYDDVVMVMRAHPTVAILPAALAAGEMTNASGYQILEAFLCGFETASRIGAVVNPSHYDNGWHATSTVGTFGAAVAAGRLLKLDAGRMAYALGLAGTQAAGLRSVFGTMTKQLHAGLACERGVRAARLAARGFTSSTRIVEADQGFAQTQSCNPQPLKAWDNPPGGFYILQTLFKYHAACYLTHSTIEAARFLESRSQVRPERIRKIFVGVDPGHLKICAIEKPRDGTELKFSLRGTAALALLRERTGDETLYTEETANRSDVVRLRDMVQIMPRYRSSHTLSDVTIVLDDGSTVEASYDAGIPATDLAAQGATLMAKFEAMTVGRLGAQASRALAEGCLQFEKIEAVRELMKIASSRPLASGPDGESDR